ncbi:MAG: adenosylcobinamide-GDP ribazoletransferase [Chloroflexota bacterium]|nr:adenosylcobinamide-GDP ribazoletransferase [Chloroflexota bacterium]
MAGDPLVHRPTSIDIAASRRARLAASPLLDLAAAVAFLTRLPVPRRWLDDGRTGAAAFGLAGATIAAAAAIPVVVAGQTHPGPTAVAGIAILAILTGALHLDGLADTADALAAPAGAADRARTDPRAGTAGVVAIVLVLLLDTALLAELASIGGWLAGAALVTAGAVSRAAATVAGVLAGPARAGGRLGAWFVARLRPADAWLAIASVAVVAAGGAALAGPSIVVGLVGGSALGLTIGALVVRLRRRLDGDGFGAVIELTFTAVLAATLVARSIGG